MKERRKYLRVECRLEVETNAGFNWFMIHSNNISLKGIMLVTESDINKLNKFGIGCDKKVKLSFYLKNKANLAKVKGRIIQIGKCKDPRSNNDMLSIGIEFTEIEDHLKKQLELFIDSKKKN